MNPVHNFIEVACTSFASLLQFMSCSYNDVLQVTKRLTLSGDFLKDFSWRVVSSEEVPSIIRGITFECKSSFFLVFVFMATVKHDTHYTENESNGGVLSFISEKWQNKLRKLCAFMRYLKEWAKCNVVTQFTCLKHTEFYMRRKKLRLITYKKKTPTSNTILKHFCYLIIETGFSMVYYKYIFEMRNFLSPT